MPGSDDYPAYPAKIERDEDGRHVVVFPDFGWGATDGATRSEALKSFGRSVQSERDREHGKGGKASPDGERSSAEATASPSPEKEMRPEATCDRVPEAAPPDLGKRVDMHLGL